EGRLDSTEQRKHGRGDDDSVDKKSGVSCNWKQPVQTKMGVAYLRPSIIGGEAREYCADDGAQEGDDGEKSRNLSVLVLRESLYLGKAGAGRFVHAVDGVIG